MIALVGDAFAHTASDDAARPLPPEQWEDLQHALARLAIDFVSGPGAIASALRRSLLGAPLNTKSVPLDIGYSDTIPESIRRAVIARDKHCAWSGGCDRRPPSATSTTSPTKKTAAPPASKTAPCSANTTTRSASTASAGNSSSSQTDQPGPPAPTARPSSAATRHPHYPSPKPGPPWIPTRIRTLTLAACLRFLCASMMIDATMGRMPHDDNSPGEISTRHDSPAADYDSFAEAYSALNEVSLYNAYYERPATLALAGDVAGRRVLDAGCGSGPLFAALRDRGAIVTGVDASARMLELARRRLGGDADLRVADLGDPLPFPDGAFDDAIASLVLHYLEDWTAPLAELRRVLRPGGRLIVSVDHPLQGHPLVRPGADYWATFQYSAECAAPNGESFTLTYWHRPLAAMISAFTNAGFRVAAIEEPLPAPDTPRELLPDSLKDEPVGSGFLCFLFFVLQAG